MTLSWRVGGPLLALAILACLLLLAWSLVAEPVLALSADRRADIAALSDRLERVQAIAARRPALERRAQQSSSQLLTQGMLWSGPSRTAVTSKMLDLLRSAATQGGGQVASSSELDNHAEAGFDRFGVRLRVEGPMNAILSVLAAVDAAQPALFVDTLMLTAGDAGTRDRPPQLGMELAVVGYGQPAP